MPVHLTRYVHMLSAHKNRMDLHSTSTISFISFALFRFDVDIFLWISLSLGLKIRLHNWMMAEWMKESNGQEKQKKKWKFAVFHTKLPMLLQMWRNCISHSLYISINSIFRIFIPLIRSSSSSVVVPSLFLFSWFHHNKGKHSLEMMMMISWNLGRWI